MKIHLLREYIKMLRIFASSSEALCYCPFILQEQVTAASKNIEFKEDETMCQGLDEKKFWLKKSATDFLLICLDISLGTQRGSQTLHSQRSCGRSSWPFAQLSLVLPNTTGGEQHVLQKTLAWEAQELLQVVSLAPWIWHFSPLGLWIS